MGYERVKNLESMLDLSREDAKVVDSLMTKIRNVSPRKTEEILKTINKIIGGFGVEAIRSEEFRGGYYGDIVAEYINMGETYTTTIVFNTITKMPMIASMGYFVEKNSRKYKII